MLYVICQDQGNMHELQVERQPACLIMSILPSLLVKQEQRGRRVRYIPALVTERRWEQISQRTRIEWEGIERRELWEPQVSQVLCLLLAHCKSHISYAMLAH